MEDSMISFRNDETYKDANKLYGRVTKFLRKILKENQDTSKDEEITATMLYEIYEAQNVTNSERMKDLIEENMQLKTEIRKLRSRYNLYLEKTHEILLVCEEESKKYEDKKETFSRKGTINSMRETFTSTFHMSHHQAKDSTGLEEEAEKLLGDDQLQTNLNKIRNLIREMSNTVRLRKNLIFQISKEYEFKKEEKQNILKENILKENILGDIEQLKNEIRPQTDAINNLAFNCKAEEPRTNEQTNDTPTNGVSELVNLVEKVPRLIPEEFVQRCQGCEVNFGLCTWKYHCRVCGFVFCFYCSWNFDNFLPFYMYAVRICNKCVASKKNKCYLKNM